MHTHQIVFTAVTFLHNLCTAIWIGGLITLTAGVFPSVRQIFGHDKKSLQLAAAIQKRQSWMVYFSIAGLALTGILLGKRNPAFSGLFSFQNNFSTILAVKHILMILMVAITLVRSVVLSRPAQWLTPAQQKHWRTALLFVNMISGILILLLSSILAAAPSM